MTGSFIRKAEVVIALLNRTSGKGGVPDDNTVGLGVSRGNQTRGRTDDGPALKEYMSSTRSLGLFSAGDIRSIV
jgi:hypothetical protein